MKLWDIIKALVEAAEDTFTDPKSGPVKQAWVRDQIINSLIGIKMSDWIRHVVNSVVVSLIEAAVIVLKTRKP